MMTKKKNNVKSKIDESKKNTKKLKKKIKHKKKKNSKNEKQNKKIDIHSILTKLPKPKKGWVLPSHQYTGPGNPLEIQLDKNDKPKKKYSPFNKVDTISMKHDICYRDNPYKKHYCDRIMLRDLKKVTPTSLRERIDKFLVGHIIKTKLKFKI